MFLDIFVKTVSKRLVRKTSRKWYNIKEVEIPMYSLEERHGPNSVKVLNVGFPVSAGRGFSVIGTILDFLLR